MYFKSKSNEFYLVFIMMFLYRKRRRKTKKLLINIHTHKHTLREETIQTNEQKHINKSRLNPNRQKNHLKLNQKIRLKTTMTTTKQLIRTKRNESKERKTHTHSAQIHYTAVYGNVS